MEPNRFNSGVVFRKTNPKTELEIQNGKAAALRGDPLDDSKSPAWKKGFDAGQCQLLREKLYPPRE